MLFKPGALTRTIRFETRYVRNADGSETSKSVTLEEGTWFEILRVLPCSFYDDGWGYLVWVPSKRVFVGLEHKSVQVIDDTTKTW